MRPINVLNKEYTLKKSIYRFKFNDTKIKWMVENPISFRRWIYKKK